MREEDKKKKELEDAEREKSSLREKEEQERADEEERKRKEEKERKEEEEYRKLAAAFTLEEEGFDESSTLDDGDEENQLQIFIQYIKVSFCKIKSIGIFRGQKNYIGFKCPEKTIQINNVHNLLPGGKNGGA